jgi:hypothetical protein
MFAEGDEEEDDEEVEEVGIFLPSLPASVLNSVRLHRCPFVSCVGWSAVFGVVPMQNRRPHQKTDHKERPSWTEWIRE